MTSEKRIEHYQSFFKRHGYFVVADAIPGQEEIWANTLAEAAMKVQGVLASNAKRHGFRGLSRNALAAPNGAVLAMAPVSAARPAHPPRLLGNRWLRYGPPSVPMGG